MTATLSDIEHVTVTVAAAVTAIAAWWGVTAWRRQLRGQTEYEVARIALRAAYRVRDALGMVRSPFMSSGEQAAALAEIDPVVKESEPSSTDARARGLAAAYQVRWRTVASALSDLDLARVEAEAMWGLEAAQCFVDLRSCARELNAALFMYLRHEQEQYSLRPRSDFDAQMERTVFAIGEDDPYAAKVKSAIDVLEAYFRPKLK